MIRDTLTRVATEFLNARNEPLTGHPLAVFLRGVAADEVRKAISRPDLKVVGAPVQGNWAEVPWIGIFNPEVTTSATRGYYVVYLFDAEMGSVKLSLGQGVTAIREEFKSKAVHEMMRRAALIRDRVPEFSEKFLTGPVALGGATQLARDYDPAVAFFASYDLVDLPDEEKILADLRAMVGLYDRLVSRIGVDSVEGAIEIGSDQDEAAAYETLEERRRYIRHQRIERHSDAAKRAKAVHGYICQACGFDFEIVYGELGKKFIEAHHLVPFASLPEGEPVTMDPKADFAVLCANCHRMVHRVKELLSIEAIRTLAGVERVRNWFPKKSPKPS